MKCPSLASLMAFDRDRATEAESAEILSHLSTGCPRCAENRAWLAEVVQTKADDASFAAPEEIIQWAVAAFKVHTSSTPTPVSRLRRLLAALLFDSLTEAPIPSVRSDLRSASTAAPRHLLYQAEGYDIDLRFEATKGAASEEIVGQVLTTEDQTDESAVYTVRLLLNDREIEIAQTDASGMFVISPVPTAAFDLQIETADAVIQISGIDPARNR